MDAIEPMAEEMGQLRFESVKTEAEAEYQDGYQEYLDGVKEYEEGKADSLADAIKEAYRLADGVQFENAYRRSDIGQRALAANK